LIKKAYQSLQQSQTTEICDEHNNAFSYLPNSASFRILFDDDGNCVTKWLGKKHLKQNVILPTNIISWIQHSKKNKKSFFYDVDAFLIHLEYIQNSVTFHCHLNYKSNGEWYDWVMIQFDNNSNKSYHWKKNVA